MEMGSQQLHTHNCSLRGSSLTQITIHANQTRVKDENFLIKLHLVYIYNILRLLKESVFKIKVHSVYMFAVVFWLPEISIGQKKTICSICCCCRCLTVYFAMKRYEKEEMGSNETSRNGNKIPVMLNIGTSLQVPALLFHIYSARRRTLKVLWLWLGVGKVLNAGPIQIIHVSTNTVYKCKYTLVKLNGQPDFHRHCRHSAYMIALSIVATTDYKYN